MPKVELNQAVLSKSGVIGPGVVDVTEDQAKDFAVRKLIVDAPKAESDAPKADPKKVK